MSKQRIPTTWKHLHPGDQIGSRLPYHRIQKLIRQMEREGWKMKAEPSDTGYWVICEQRPGNEH